MPGSLLTGDVLGDMGFSAMRSATRLGGVLLGFGLQAAGLQDGEPSDELLYAHVYYSEAGEWIYCGCSSNAVAQVEGEVSWWDFLRWLFRMRTGLCVCC